MSKHQEAIRRVACKLLTLSLMAALTPPGWADTAGTRSSLDQYRAHLSQLEQVVASCRATVASCKSDAVGADDLLDLNGKLRRVDYGWLRDTLSEAANGATKGDLGVKSKKEASAKLDAATHRLQEDDAQAVLLSAPPRDPMRATLNGAPPALRSVLSASEFHNMTQPSLWDRAMQRVYEWLDGRLRALGSVRPPSRNLVRLLVYGSILICLTLLVWWYARQVRQQRIVLAASTRAPHPGAASAVDWQQRLHQAQALAVAGDWREAVHLVYWAAISRLESLGNWPADRARTPREYLQLLPASHRKRSDLTLLTRRFEVIWYGHARALQSDFDEARLLIERLASE
jgi:hypothetical protein